MEIVKLKLFPEIVKTLQSSSQAQKKVAVLQSLAANLIFANGFVLGTFQFSELFCGGLFSHLEKTDA